MGFFGLAWSTSRYRSKQQNDDDLQLVLIRHAKQYRGHGYRKVGVFMRMEGWRNNHKKLESLWREEGLHYRNDTRSTGGSAIRTARSSG